MNLPTLSSASKVEKSLDISRALLFVPPVLAILVCLLIAFFVVWPRFNDVLRLQKSNKILVENALALEQKVIALQSVDKSKLKSQLLAASQLVPSDKNIFNFIAQAEETRNSSGVAITNLSVGTVGQFGTAKPDASQKTAPTPPPATNDSAPAAGASEVQMKLSLTSDYKSLLQFLDGVYALPRVVIVKDIAFASVESQITTSMTINALWQPLPGELASVQAPLLKLTKSQEDLLAKIETSGTSITVQAVPEAEGRNDIFTPFGQ